MYLVTTAISSTTARTAIRAITHESTMRFTGRFARIKSPIVLLLLLGKSERAAQEQRI
jgi:hypothetical protein